ncbi:MAG: tetratricopeptide repeat protein, partial [Gammaproteobacteria bacterium]
LHSVKGWCHLWAGEAALARRHFNEALRLNPYNQTRLLEASGGHMFLDDIDQAAALLERCRDLTPFDTHTGHEEQALLHLLRHEFDLAAGQLAIVRSGHPDDGETTEPTILSELYALLAAAGAGAPDLEDRGERWRERMRLRWAGEGPPDTARLVQWALNHTPFVSAARRGWMLDLLQTALAAAPPDRRRTHSPAPRGKPSARLAAETPAKAEAPPRP